MCLVVVARGVDPRFPLVVVANRDETHARRTSALHLWEPAPGRVVLSGRDDEAGGTWAGVAPGGRFAAVTNVREGAEVPAERSRGELPVRFLAGTRRTSGRRAARALAPGAGGDADGPDLDSYGPVNVLVGDVDELWWVSNRGARRPGAVPQGVHGLSNAGLDTPWPKLVAAVDGVRTVLGRGIDPEDPEWARPLARVLADRRCAPPTALPRTGVPLWQEWRLSARFVRMGWYGTRSTSVTRIDTAGRADAVEWTFDRWGRSVGEVSASL